MRVLGVEGTAWAASAAVYDEPSGVSTMHTEPYTPESGGLHPREAAEHMSDAIPRVIDATLADASPDELDAIAFSRGPGLGPCLRIVATAARTLAQRLNVPLVGVNHMVAHLEIGRQRSGFAAPVCLNASGANAHVLAFQGGRYRVLGETMDTGVGNAIDKFTRHLGWEHPGGPKVEARAADGTYHPLPYVVKGMDFSFAGITSAAIEAAEADVPVEDICRGLQETIFAMLTEVSERALSLTGRDELVLGGGVGQNDRLQGMLASMCRDRDAAFFAPPDRLLRDNAGMIAALGAQMAAAGDTITVEDSAIRSDFRPDEVPVTWREPPPPPSPAPVPPGSGPELGAEATVDLREDVVVKTRRAKEYRHPALDRRLRRERTGREARLTSLARRHGVPTPVVIDVQPGNGRIEFQRVGTADLRDIATEARSREVGRLLARLHEAGVVHGDPTPRNVRVDEARDRVYLIDFGLGFHSDHVEDFAMDIHVFHGSVAGTSPAADRLQEACEAGYVETGDPAVIERLREIERRGRYRGG